MSQSWLIGSFIPIFFYQVCCNIEKSVVTNCKNILFCLTFLKKSLSYQYNLLTMISGLDFIGFKSRFCVVYELLSPFFNSRIRIKCYTNEGIQIESSTSLFRSANWWEREIWDLFGILFSKHPDLRRLLTDYGFEGHPMRKDFPLYGFLEYKYSEKKSMVIPVNVFFSQENRKFITANSW